MAEIELQADQEHQHDQAELAEDGEYGPDAGVEDRVKEAWEDLAEQGRSQNKPGGNLSAHDRLTQTLKYIACDPSRSNNHYKLNDDQKQSALRARVYG